MPPVAGELYVPSLDVPGTDAQTQVQVAVLDPDEVPATLPTTAPAPAGGAPGTLWTAAPITLQPGEYRITWSVTTPAGTSSTAQILAVDPDPGAAPAGFSFATTGDYVRYTGQPMPAGLHRALIAASTEIERITVSARYALDPRTGRAADPTLRQALAEATCELVGWWAETGTETGGRHLITSASIAGVSIGYGGANTANPQADRVGPKVWSILMRAGLLTPGGVLTDG